MVQHALRELAHLGRGLEALDEAAVGREVEDGGLAGLGQTRDELGGGGVAHEVCERGVREKALDGQADAGAAPLEGLGGRRRDDRGLRETGRGGPGDRASKRAVGQKEAGRIGVVEEGRKRGGRIRGKVGWGVVEGKDGEGERCRETGS